MFQAVSVFGVLANFILLLQIVVLTNCQRYAVPAANYGGGNAGPSVVQIPLANGGTHGYSRHVGQAFTDFVKYILTGSNRSRHGGRTISIIQNKSKHPPSAYPPPQPKSHQTYPPPAPTYAPTKSHSTYHPPEPSYSPPKSHPTYHPPEPSYSPPKSHHTSHSSTHSNHHHDTHSTKHSKGHEIHHSPHQKSHHGTIHDHHSSIQHHNAPSHSSIYKVSESHPHGNSHTSDIIYTQVSCPHCENFGPHHEAYPKNIDGVVVSESDKHVEFVVTKNEPEDIMFHPPKLNTIFDPKFEKGYRSPSHQLTRGQKVSGHTINSLFGSSTDIISPSSRDQRFKSPNNYDFSEEFRSFFDSSKFDDSREYEELFTRNKFKMLTSGETGFVPSPVYVPKKYRSKTAEENLIRFLLQNNNNIQASRERRESGYDKYVLPNFSELPLETTSSDELRKMKSNILDSVLIRHYLAANGFNNDGHSTASVAVEHKPPSLSTSEETFKLSSVSSTGLPTAQSLKTLQFAPKPFENSIPIDVVDLQKMIANFVDNNERAKNFDWKAWVASDEEVALITKDTQDSVKPINFILSNSDDVNDSSSTETNVISKIENSASKETRDVVFGVDSVLGALKLVMKAVENTNTGQKLYLVRSMSESGEKITTRISRTPGTVQQQSTPSITSSTSSAPSSISSSATSNNDPFFDVDLSFLEPTVAKLIASFYTSEKPL